jgi:hypothetical protein
MPMTTDWIAIIMKDTDNAEGNPWLEVEHAFGPFVDKDSATSWANWFNREHDGSDWWAVVRSLTKVDL